MGTNTKPKGHARKRIAIVGNLAAGKTTLLNQFIVKGILKPDRYPTAGLKNTEVDLVYGGLSLEAIVSDVGGAVKHRGLWSKAITKADAVIIVIDSTIQFLCNFYDNQVEDYDFKTFNTCQNKIKDDGRNRSYCGCEENKEFITSNQAVESALGLIHEDRIRLILFNKIDLTESQPESDLIFMYELQSEAKNDKSYISSISALMNMRIEEPMKWLISKIS